MTHRFIKPSRKLDTDVKYSSLGYIYAETGKTGQQIGPIPIHNNSTRPSLNQIPTGVVIYNSDTNSLQISDKQDENDPKWVDISNAGIVFDNAVLVSGNQTISGQKIFADNIVFNQDVTIIGDLIVSGTSTYLQTENLYVEDNIITLNSSVSGSPLLDAGIEINRGSSTDALLLWNETTDQWEVGLSGSTSPIATLSELNSASGYLMMLTNSGDANAVASGNSALLAYSGYAESAFVNTSGDTMTGALVLNADPSAALEAATKQYVDAAAAAAAGSGTANASLLVQEDNVNVYSGAIQLDFGHALDVASGSGEAQVSVDESEFTSVVFLTGAQTISGIKTFVNDINFNGNILPSTSGSQSIGTSGVPLGAIYANTFISTGSPGLKLTRSGGAGVVDTTEDNNLLINRNGLTQLSLLSNTTRVHSLFTASNLINVEGSSISLLSATSGSPVTNASLNIIRGSSSPARFLWDESVDNWKIGISGTEQIVATEATALLKANNLSDLTSITGARSNLGLGSLAIKNTINNSDWSGTALAISNGGTGASDASTARSNLGLGSVAIESIVPIAKGGTGSSTAPGARSNLGAAGSGANSDITSTTALTSISTTNLSVSGSTKITLSTASNSIEFANVNFFQPTTNFGANLGDQGKAYNGITTRDIKNDSTDHLRILVTNSKELQLYGGASGITPFWIFGNTGIFTGVTDGLQDLGTASSRFRNVYSTGGIVTFTGKHLYKMGDLDLEIGEAVILVDDKVYRASQENASNCVGILAGYEITDVNDIPISSASGSIIRDSFGSEIFSTDRMCSVAAVGDSRTVECSGFIVCDEGGPITPGTLLVTASGVPGALKAQSDSLIRSYTVGKSIESVDFSTSSVVSGVYGYLYCG